MKTEDLANLRHYLSKDYINKHKGAVALAILLAAENAAGIVSGVYTLYTVTDLKNRVAQIEQNHCTITLPDNR